MYDSLLSYDCLGANAGNFGDINDRVTNYREGR
jgi:hypothetical protein